jgi:hypothetical protein
MGGDIAAIAEKQQLLVIRVPTDRTRLEVRNIVVDIIDNHWGIDVGDLDSVLDRVGRLDGASRTGTQLHNIEAATTYRTTVGTLNPRLQTVVVQDMPAREQLGDLTRILITIANIVRLDQIIGIILPFEIRSWHEFWGDGTRIAAGAFAKVS